LVLPLAMFTWRSRQKEVALIESTERAMRNLTTKNKERIRQAIDFLTVNRRPIEVVIHGETTRFSSKILKTNHGDPASGSERVRNLVIDFLFPATGNNLIQSASPIYVKFSLGKHECEFTSYYITRSMKLGYLGHIITYPESLVIADRRRHERYEIGTEAVPFFVKAKLTMRVRERQRESYDLKIFDVSENGVGILVDRELHGLLDRIEIGDRLEKLELYATWTMVKVAGTVRHKSKMREGQYSGYFLLGIQLDEKLEHYI
jgi:c-di-GMP-binding flagellar brake protein YcgR